MDMTAPQHKCVNYSFSLRYLNIYTGEKRRRKNVYRFAFLAFSQQLVFTLQLSLSANFAHRCSKRHAICKYF